MRIAALLLTVTLLPVPARAADPDKAIADAVQTAQKAGFERHDLKAYMAVFAPGARLVAQRIPGGDAFDQTLDREQIEATKSLIFSSAPGGISMRFDDVKVVRKGATAELTWTAHLELGGGQFSEVVSEIYLLTRTGAGWLVTENRYTLASFGPRGQEQHVSAEHWKRADADVAAARRSGSVARLVGALVEAHRLKEAHALMKTVTRTQRTTALSWAQRAAIALRAGDAADARESALEAKKLDPTVELPGWAQKL